MARPVEEHELSGLLDGQLDPERAREVREAILADERLKVEYERLAGLDQQLIASAREAIFRPAVSLPSSGLSAYFAIILAAAIFVLVVVRMLPKLKMLFASAIAVNALALVVLVAVLVLLCRKLDSSSAENYPVLPASRSK